MDVGKIHSIELLVGLTHVRQNNNVPRFHNAAHSGRKTWLPWYRQLEASGQNTSYSTATALLKALNEERLLRGLEALSLEQLGPKII